jgi:3-oxosteroid 1-dehydrogenase
MTAAGAGQWDETFDLIAIGSGGGALCSALVAHSHGKRVVVLEKMPQIGGTSARSGGAVWIPFNHLMAKEGIADSYEQARLYLDGAINEQGVAASPARIDAYLRTGPTVMRFLESQGLKLRRAEGYADLYACPGNVPRGRALEAELLDSRELGPWADRINRYAGFALPVYVAEFPPLANATRTWKGRITALKLMWRMMLQRVRGAPIFGQGAALQGRLLQMLLKRNIDIRLETPVTELVVENGAVVGVVARHNGRTVRLRATGGVLVNAGGFSNNMAMRKEFLPDPQTTTEYYLGNAGDTGEVLRMVMDLGAATDQMEEAYWVVSSKLPNGLSASHTFDLSKPYSILVDSSGVRYANEAQPFMDLGQAMFQRHKQVPAVPSWAILESRHRERYSWGMALPGATPEDWFTQGYMQRADTIEDLAVACGLDPLALRATVDRFNRFAAAGKDEDFARGESPFQRMGGDPTIAPNPSLGPIAKPPFYAAKIYVGDVGTCGGLVTDADARVLRDNGAPIPGLYACGNSAANCMGRTYVGPGSTLGQTYIFGYRAAHHALRINADGLSPDGGS